MINHIEQNMTLSFKVTGQGHIALTLIFALNHNIWQTVRLREFILTCAHIINYGKQNVTLILKVKGHSANALKSQYLATFGRGKLILTCTPT